MGGATLPIDRLPSVDQAALERIRKLRPKLVESAREVHRHYTSKVPKSGESYEMVAIPGGEFLMGSPASDPHRFVDEMPQVKVRIKPFWMGKYEVTWDLYEPFMITNVSRNKDGSLLKVEEGMDAADLVSAPTTPYQEMSFGMGTKGYPAVCMTHHAASKFCEWLSFQTGHYYRLPTEAEWEYACRAGTTTIYHFGDDPAQLGEYDVYDPEQKRTGYEKVGTKKPNPWGLYDMHGNVIEWCLDLHEKVSYRSWKSAGEPVEAPYVAGVKLYSHVARGGSWYDKADLCRSAARVASSPDWKVQDPFLPKSYWYHTDAVWLGFRFVRPTEIPSAEDIYFMWNSSGIEDKGGRP